MDFVLACLSVLVATLFFQIYFWLSSTSSNLPPGPKPLPIVGNLLQLGDKPHQSLANLAKIHGSILTLRLGQITTIVISSAPLAKEILKTQDQNFCNRKLPDAVNAGNHHELGIIWMPVSSAWTNMRKICNSYIFATQKLDAKEESRRLKIYELLQNAERYCLSGTAMNIGEAAFNTIINFLSNMIFSLDLADPTKEVSSSPGFKNLMRSLVDEIKRPNLADYYPFLKKIDPQCVKRRFAYFLSKLFDLFDVIINERLEMRKRNNGPVTTVDVLDTLLNKIEDDSETLSLNDIKHLFVDLLVAGTDTTSSTLEWAMSELLRHPESISEVRAEMEEKIGKGNFVKESDIQDLHYLQAVIKETLRLHPPVPLLLPRQSCCDAQIEGFTVPANSMVFVNVWAIGRDPCLWDEPNCFIPKRFLESNFDYKGNDFSFVPFGGGRRICPGISLATRMLPLMLGSLIHTFDWNLESGEKFENLDMEEKFSVSLQKAQPLRAIPLPLPA